MAEKLGLNAFKMGIQREHDQSVCGKEVYYGGSELVDGWQEAEDEAFCVEGNLDQGVADMGKEAGG